MYIQKVTYRSFRAENYLGTKVFISEDLWASKCDNIPAEILYMLQIFD